MPDLLVAGTLHTLDPERPVASAVLIRDGRFVRVGTREECERKARSDLQFIELRDGCAVPGLIDAHGHPLLHARTLKEVRLNGATSEQECVDRVVRFAATVPEGTWIRGSGWDQNLWPGHEFPGPASLSAAMPRHPVALSRVDVHALWCNESALRAGGVGSSTPDPPGGRILRREDETPSGVLIDTAMEMVLRAIPPPGPRETEQMLLRSLHAQAAAGLTAVHDASAGPEVLAAYARLAESDSLPVRVYAMINGQGADLDEQMRAWSERRSIGLLCVRSVKLFADGALGSRGAAMCEPYEDEPGNSGLWLLDPRELEDRIERVAAAGYQPSVHCIGDRACALVLRAFTRVPGALRPRAEHLQILRARCAAAEEVGSDRLDAAGARDQRRALGRRAPRARHGTAARRVRLEAGARRRCAARIRQRFPGGDDGSAGRPARGGDAQAGRRSALDAGAAPAPRRGLARVHGRRGLGRV